MGEWEFDPFAPRRRAETVAEPVAETMAAPPVPPPAPAFPAPPVAVEHMEERADQPPTRKRARRIPAQTPAQVVDQPVAAVASLPETRKQAAVEDVPAVAPAQTAEPPVVRPPGYRLSVKEMAPDERPRERLKLRGPASLSDGDLLAILLNTGIVGETVTDVAQRLLAEHGGIRGLLRMETDELARVRGIGDAKAVRLKAALEIGRRLAALGAEARPKITSPDEVASLLQVEMAALEQEQLRVVLLDTKHQVLAVRTVVQGSVNQAQVRVAEVFRDAVRQNAVALVAAHNHPSGDPTPSAADVSLTLELVQAGTLLDIEVLDHLILGQGRWVSLRRLGLGFPAS